MLHYEAVSEDLLNVIKHLMELEELKSFALVGGTALALHLGHRSSVDIDLFTDHSFDVKETITVILKNVKGNVILARPNGAQLLLNDIKVDLYNWAVPFLEDTFEDGLRLASLKDIAAFKLDAVSSRKTKKDFYDIYFLLTQMSFSEMISCYQKKSKTANKKLLKEKKRSGDLSGRKKGSKNFFFFKIIACTLLCHAAAFTKDTIS